MMYLIVILFTFGLIPLLQLLLTAAAVVLTHSKRYLAAVGTGLTGTAFAAMAAYQWYGALMAAEQHAALFPVRFHPISAAFFAVLLTANVICVSVSIAHLTKKSAQA